MKWQNGDTHLFTPEPAIRGGRGGGATLDYWLKAAPQGPLTIEFSDGSGKVIRTFTARGGRGAENAGEETPEAGGRGGGRGGFGGAGAMPTTNAGMNRFTWDLRTDAPTQVPGAVYWGGRAGGAVVPTGSYNVKLSAGGQSVTAKIEVKTDPRMHRIAGGSRQAIRVCDAHQCADHSRPRCHQSNPRAATAA